MRTDEELMEDFLVGNEAAFTEIVSRHDQRLARIAYRITGCVHAAEDVRNGVLVRLIQWPTVRNVTNLGAWLTRCVVNEAIAYVRARGREVRALTDLAHRSSLMESDNTIRVLRQEAASQLSHALSQLTANQRALLSLRFDEDLTFREIAELLNRPATTIKSQLYVAIGQLRELL